MDDCCFPLQRKSPSRVHCEEGTPPTKLTHTTAPRRSTVSRAGSWRVFRYDGIFYSMIFGGEMSKIGHGVGRYGCHFWRLCDVALFFCGCSRATSKKSHQYKFPFCLKTTITTSLALFIVHKIEGRAEGGGRRPPVQSPSPPPRGEAAYIFVDPIFKT
jgi:hypothetical protein